MEEAIFSFEEITSFRISQCLILLKSLPTATGFLLGNKVYGIKMATVTNANSFAMKFFRAAKRWQLYRYFLLCFFEIELIWKLI